MQNYAQNENAHPGEYSCIGYVLSNCKQLRKKKHV